MPHSLPGYQRSSKKEELPAPFREGYLVEDRFETTNEFEVQEILFEGDSEIPKESKIVQVDLKKQCEDLSKKAEVIDTDTKPETISMRIPSEAEAVVTKENVDKFQLVIENDLGEMTGFVYAYAISGNVLCVMTHASNSGSRIKPKPSAGRLFLSIYAAASGELCWSGHVTALGFTFSLNSGQLGIILLEVCNNDEDNGTEA